MVRCPLPAGFLLERSGVLESWGLPWRLIRDARTGASIIHVVSDSEEHFMGLSLLTPPGDATGIPHILEHCVLNGSHSYPVRDAFNELWRGSLHSHLNAVTYPDRTVYFAGSTHRGEFTNLCRVYFDLVFNPLLDRRRMLLESFHLRPDRRGLSLVGKPSGVIYSEMQGSYSDPEELAFLKVQSEILPDTPYRNDSGGNPSEMGNISWRGVTEYHRLHYTPANAKIFVCSPMDTPELAAFLGGVLPPGVGSKAPPPPVIPLQRRWGRPRRVRLVTPSEPGGATVSFSWLLGETGDAEEAALAQILEEILLSDAGSLNRTILESGLGIDIATGTGLELDLREMIFTVGLRGTFEHRADAIRRIILSDLSRFAGVGPDRDLLEAAVCSMLFSYMDRVEDFPLRLFTRAMRAWAYDMDPAEWMDHAVPIRRLAGSRDLVERLEAAVRTWFLDNPHRLQLLVAPIGRGNRRERLVRLDPERHGAVSSEALELDDFASQEDSPAALGTIPRLDADELPLEERNDLPRPSSIDGSDLLLLDGHGRTAWLELAFDASGLTDAGDLHLPLALRAITGMGTKDLDHRALAIRIARDTGGLDPEPVNLEDVETGRPAPVVMISLGFLPGRPLEALETLRTVCLETSLDDRKRLLELVEEQRGEALSDLVSSADWYARSAAAAALSRSAALKNDWEGLPQMEFLYGLRERNMPALAGRLGILTGELFTRSRLKAVSCFPGADPEPVRNTLASFIDSLPAGTAPTTAVRETPSGARNVLMRLRSGVSTVCVAVDAPRLRSEAAAVFAVGCAALSDGLLYRRLRVAGGAYEVAAWHDPLSGLAFLTSHRDPDPARTRTLISEAALEMVKSPPSEEDVRLAVLSAFSGLERPLGPRGRCRLGLSRHLTGISRADMERLRRSLAGLRRDDLIERFPELLGRALESSSTFIFAPGGAGEEELFGRGAEVTVLSAGRYK